MKMLAMKCLFLKTMLFVAVVSVCWSGAVLAVQSQDKPSHKTHQHGASKVAYSLAQRCASPFAVPSADCAKAPMPIFSAEGDLWLSFVSHGHVYVARSENLGVDFSVPVAVNRVPEHIYADKENRPKLAFGHEGEIYVSWTRKRKAKYSGEVRFSRSLDQGATFEASMTPIDEGALTSHRFDNMAVDKQGRLYLAWIDRRDKAAADAIGQEYPGGSVYYSVSSDSGATFTPNIKVIDNSCECCRMRIESANDGSVHALWRNIYPGSTRDNAMAVLSGSSLVKAPVRVSYDEWQIDACPHHGPDISLDNEDRLHATWFNGGGKRVGLVYGRFDAEQDLLEHDMSIDSSSAASHPRVLAMGDTVYIAWTHRVDKGAEVRLMESSDAGATWSKYRVVASTESDSDQVFLLDDGKEPFVSWRTHTEGYRLINVNQKQAALAGSFSDS